MFDLDKFLESVENLGWIEIIDKMDKEVSKVEGMSYSVRGAPRVREMGGPAYAQELKGYLFFLRTGKEPGGVSILPLKKICENLVEKKEFKPSVLDYFN